MTFWPASKARSDAIMSTIARRIGAGAFERAGAHLARGPPRRRRAGEEVVAGLLGVVTAKTPSVRGSTLPSAPTRQRLAVAAEDRVAVSGRQPAVGVGRELAVARVARALGGLDGEEAVAVDREVQRLARLLERLRASSR